MSFLETPRFSDQIAYRSAVGPLFRTTKVETLSGRTFANQEWPSHLWRFDLVPALKQHPEFKSEIVDFYIAVAGGANGFRIKNPLDWKSCPVDQTPTKDDQLLGTGDGVEDEFQVIKKTTIGALTTTKTIYKLVAGTLLVAVAGVLKTAPTEYTYDDNTGLITFEPGAIPAMGEDVTAGYENDTPVTFESDELSILLQTRSGSDLILGLQSLALVEMRNPL